MHESRLKKCVESRETVQWINIQKKTELSFCEGCLAGKMCRKPFPAVGEIRSMRKLQLVHSDVCGPMHTHTRLEERSISLRLLMITLGAVLYIS